MAIREKKISGLPKFDKWKKENKEKNNKWWNKNEQIFFKFKNQEELQELWNKNKCHYCECSGEELAEFYNPSESRRYATRGRNFEVDRIDEFNKNSGKNKLDFPAYSLDNCVLSCYWCNNAKSDVFAEKEFCEIGEAIGKIIRNRNEKRRKRK